MLDYSRLFLTHLVFWRVRDGLAHKWSWVHLFCPASKMYISKYFNSKNFQSACSKHLLLLKVGDMLFAILVSDDA